MTTQADIERQIQEDVSRFNNAIYDGFLPPNFFENFKKAVMAIPYTTHMIPLDHVERVIEKGPHELTIVDVGMMNNMLNSARPCDMYSSLEEYLGVMRDLRKQAVEYNKNVASFDRKMQIKRERLMDIAGLNNKTVPMNGMKTVPVTK